MDEDGAPDSSFTFEQDIVLPGGGEDRDGDMDRVDNETFDIGADTSDQVYLHPAEDQSDLNFVRTAFPSVFCAQWSQITSLERQPVVIEARALFGMAIDDLLINCEFGGESLHVVYNFERILHRLHEKGWDIVVGFFKVLPYEDAQSAQHKLLAEILYNHLQFLASAKPDILSVEFFDNWWGEDWARFLADHHPSLVVLDIPQKYVDPETLDDTILTIDDRLEVMLLDMFVQNVRTISSDFRIDTSSTWSFELSLRANFQVSCLESLHQAMTEQVAVPSSENVHESDFSSVKDSMADFDFALKIINLALIRVLRSNSSQQNISFAKCYLLSHLLSRVVPLDVRCQAFTRELSPSDFDQLTTFVTNLTRELASALDYVKSDKAFTAEEISFIGDLMGGRFFTLLVIQVSTFSAIDNANTIGWPSESQTLANQAWGVVAKALELGGDFFPLSYSVSAPLQTVETKQPTPSVEGFINLQSDFISAIPPMNEIESIVRKLGILTTEDNPYVCNADDLRYCNGTVEKFEEQAQGERATGRELRWKIRNRQKYYTFLEHFGGSLQSGSTKRSHVVLARSDSLPAPIPEPDPKAKKQQKGGKGGRGGKGKKGHVNHKEKILAATKEKSSADDLTTIKSAIKFADEEPEVKAKILYLSPKLQELKSKGGAPPAMIHGYLKLIQWCMKEWEAQCVTFDDDEDEDDFEVIDYSGGERDYSGAVHVVRLCYDLYDFYGSEMGASDVRAVQGHLLTLGFPEAAEQIYNDYAKRVPANAKNAKLNRKRVSALEKACSVEMSFATFQLAHCGHLMQRSFDSQKDPRVIGFSPDKWQRDLIDIVDKGDSALVVAPTSSGKTFISYYTMKKILDGNKQSKYSKAKLVVYVAPTKALLRQVETEVYKHYGPVVGVDSDEYTQNVDSCQVLITIPQALERVLLLPGMASRIEYCILDEVHCIQDFGTGDDSGEDSGAIVWEHIIGLLTCPFIALSATIGNPKEFCSWLSQAQARHFRTVHLIEHNYRWSDLRLSVHLPENTTEKPAFKNTLRPAVGPGLAHLHPVAGLSLFCVQHGKLDCIRIAPDECYQLYNTMETVVEGMGLDALSSQLKPLHPDKYFSGIIRRINVYNYESELKKLLFTWSNSEEHKNVVEHVISELAGEKHGAESSYPATNRFVNDHFLNMLVELYNTNKLPALVFVLARGRCNRLGFDLIQTLEKLEQAEKMKPSYIRKLKEIEKQERKAEKDTKRKRDKEEREVKTLQDAVDTEETIIIPHVDKPLAKFSFIPKTDSVHIEDREYWLNRIPNDPAIAILVRGLDRGIAIHHAGLPTPYRTAVEALFRAGHLKVVISTGTLSLGINMPCKTVVFAGDYPSLTPLTYQQMSGRAGRRGNDDFGNVVFFGLPKHRVFTLISANITNLVGNQPITPSLTLRSLMSYYSANDLQKEDTAIRLAGLLNPSLLSSNKPKEIGDDYNLYGKYLFRAYIDFLHRMALVSEKSVPVDLAKVAAELFQVEPSNFFICLFLLNGLLDKISESTDETDVLRLLSYIIEPVPVTNLMSSMADKEKDLQSQAMIVLPTFDEQLQTVLDAFQQKTLDLFVVSLRKLYASFGVRESARCLPFSDIRVGASVNGFSCPSGDNLIATLQKEAIPVVVRSPFVALSGHFDYFKSAQELAATSVSHIPVEANHIPSLSICDVRGRTLKLSSYAMDFFRIGKKTSLVSENGLRESTAWTLLKKWVDNLSKLKSYDTKAKKHFEELHEQFEKKHKKFNA